MTMVNPQPDGGSYYSGVGFGDSDVPSLSVAAMAGFASEKVTIGPGLVGGLASVPSDAVAAIIQFSHLGGVSNWNYTVDGTVPDATTGFRAKSGDKVLVHGQQVLAQLRFFNFGLSNDSIWAQYMKGL